MPEEITSVILPLVPHIVRAIRLVSIQAWSPSGGAEQDLLFFVLCFSGLEILTIIPIDENLDPSESWPRKFKRHTVSWVVLYAPVLLQGVLLYFNYFLCITIEALCPPNSSFRCSSCVLFFLHPSCLPKKTPRAIATCSRSELIYSTCNESSWCNSASIVVLLPDCSSSFLSSCAFLWSVGGCNRIPWLLLFFFDSAYHSCLERFPTMASRVSSHIFLAPTRASRQGACPFARHALSQGCFVVSMGGNSGKRSAASIRAISSLNSLDKRYVHAYLSFSTHVEKVFNAVLLTKQIDRASRNSCVTRELNMRRTTAFLQQKRWATSKQSPENDNARAE